MIRTRFAPSPTGYLHIGGARTALFSWAYARKHGGKFILRVEDTDLERSTQESVQAILDGMQWLGLACDEGPFYQMQRLARYQEVAEQLVNEGKAYRCYCTKEELDAMREAQRARGEKPRYDGRWRDSLEKPPAGVKPVIRFRNPQEGEVSWADEVKGLITIGNGELDDLVLLRGDGVPTYNFGVVVDDLDMNITHVIRGDDHVNNTPRQINLYKALGAALPKFGHVPMILGHDGERLSKRHGAVSVMQYHEDGYLPEALNNYLARLGWSHGNDELFSRQQLVDWFDPSHLSKSAAQWDPKKLNWVNAHYLKQADDNTLAQAVTPRIVARGGNPAQVDLLAVVRLFRDRAETLEQLAEGALLFCGPFRPATEELIAQHLTAAARVALRDFATQAAPIPWSREALGALIKTVLATHGLKMPQLAIPLRVAVAGTTQTPAVDAVLEILGKETVLARLAAFTSAEN